ncbi:MAG: YihY/virulence factor BrkB family protein [Kofleriaceae bacterium]
MSARTVARAAVDRVTAAFRIIVDEGLDDLAAMMTYYAVLALFPMLVFVVTLALLLVPTETLQAGVAAISAPLPGGIRALLHDQVSRLAGQAGAGFAFGSALVALWGASRGASALGVTLDRIDGVETSRAWCRRQVRAITVTIGVAALLLTAILLMVFGPVMGRALARWLEVGAWFPVVWTVGRWLLAGATMMLVWAVIYRFLSSQPGPFRLITPGAIIGVLLWFAASWGLTFGLRIAGSFEATYGALAGVVVFLIWLWLSNLALLIGARIDRAVSTRWSRAQASPSRWARALSRRDAWAAPPPPAAPQRLAPPVQQPPS